MTTPKESGWKEEFREYFDKALKPKKPTMKNLDRELLVDFISKVEATAIAQERARLREEVVKLPTYIINESWARNINEVVALRDVLALLRDET